MSKRRQRFIVLTMVGAAALLSSQPFATCEAVEALAAKQRAAASLVREALQRESYGMADERRALLAEASRQDPMNAAAHWQQGLVRDGFGQWVRPEEMTLNRDTTRALAEYRRVRHATADTLDANLRLADWAAEHQLQAQEWAHLTRVLVLSPDHPEARRRLGFVRVGDDWFSLADAEAEISRRAKHEAALAAYLEPLRAIRRDLQHRSQARQQAGQKRLEEIADPHAIPAIELVLGGGSESEAYSAVEKIACLEGEEAVHALCRFALLSQSAAVRSAAAEKLKQRDVHAYVPDLLDLLQLPLQSQYVAKPIEDGTVQYQHLVVREGRTNRDFALLNTRIAPPVLVREVVTPDASVGRMAGEQIVRSAREAYRKSALERAAKSAAENEAAVRYQNSLIADANRLVMETLSTSTGQPHADPESWWQWWLREVDRQSLQKKVSLRKKTQYRGFKSAAIVTVAHRAASCFAAGTPVWTIDGKQTIETIRVGDMVLSKNVESGELAYKPVLQTTVRPPSGLLKLSVGDDFLSTTQGHLFWRSGKGWQQARQLEIGCLLHAASGPVRLNSAQADGAAETYNLVVADFNTYFVGDAKLLSHDVTEQQPTDVSTPGLSAE